MEHLLLKISCKKKRLILIIDMEKYTAHETAVIDEGCEIGKGTKIWHFSHIMPKCRIGEHCNIGQNVVISPEVILGRNVKVQNNVSIYTCKSMSFLRRHVITS